MTSNPDEISKNSSFPCHHLFSMTTRPREKGHFVTGFERLNEINGWGLLNFISQWKGEANIYKPFKCIYSHQYERRTHKNLSWWYFSWKEDSWSTNMPYSHFFLKWFHTLAKQKKERNCVFVFCFFTASGTEPGFRPGHSHPLAPFLHNKPLRPSSPNLNWLHIFLPHYWTQKC